MQYKKKTKTYTGLKGLILLVSFLATLYYSFATANEVIHWIASGIQNADLHLIVLIGLWVFGFGTIVALAFGLSALVAAILARLFDL